MSENVNHLYGKLSMNGSYYLILLVRRRCCNQIFTHIPWHCLCFGFLFLSDYSSNYCCNSHLSWDYFWDYDENMIFVLNIWICKTKVVQTIFDYLNSWVVALCNFTFYVQTLEIIKLKNWTNKFESSRWHSIILIEDANKLFTSLLSTSCFISLLISWIKETA